MRAACDLPNREFRAYQTHDPILVALHLATLCRPQIVVAAQVQQPVDRVARDFGLPGGFEIVRLFQRVGNGNENLAVQMARGTSVIECDDIGRAFVLQKLLVHARHLGRIDQVKAKFVIAQCEFVFENVTQDAAEQGNVHCPGALAIPKNKDARPAL